MDARQHLFYGLGQVAYAIAISDGKIQREEEEALLKLVQDGFRELGGDITYTEIIFLINEKDKNRDGNFLYREGVKNIDLGSHHFTPELKEGFLSLLNKIAASFDSVSSGEQVFLNQFKQDIEQI